MLPVFLLAASLVGCVAATTVSPAAAKCVNGTKTYKINFDSSKNGNSFPTAANLTYNNFRTSDKFDLCKMGADPSRCTIAPPQSGPNYLYVDILSPFNAASISNLPSNFAGNPTPQTTFALESFYFACYTFDGNINYVDAPCTLQTVSAPIFAGNTLVTSAHPYVGNNSTMQKVVLGDAQTNTVFFTLISGTSRTAILLDSLVVKTPC